jgi:hypothetical protein
MAVRQNGSSMAVRRGYLIVLEMKVFRTIYGLKIENGVYRRWYNHELDKEFNEKFVKI